MQFYNNKQWLINYCLQIAGDVVEFISNCGTSTPLCCKGGREGMCWFGRTNKHHSDTRIYTSCVHLTFLSPLPHDNGGLELLFTQGI